MNKYDGLKLENQLCFPFYVCSKEIIKLYKIYLDEIDLTYTQYIAMMVLWEKKEINVKELGDELFLDSGTLTPLLKKLENKGLISRNKNKNDKRHLIISVTDMEMEFRDKAVEIPEKIAKYLPLSHEEAVQLYKLLYKCLEYHKNNM